jgi:lysophospholipase L1-like esterase
VGGDVKAARIPRVLVFNALLLLVAVVVLELVFGNWIRPNRLYRLNLIRDRTIQYDASPLYDPPRVVSYTRDEWGLRGAYDSPGAIDILTIGGSATDQRFIADGETWQDVMAREFEREGRRASVVNAGVDGQSTYGLIRNFEWWFPEIPGFKPRVVLIYVGGNDVFKDEGSDYDDVLRTKRVTWKTRIRDSSALYHVWRTVKSTWHARRVHRLDHHREDFDALRWTRTPKVADHAALLAPRLDAYRARLRRLAELTRALGATPVFVTQPMVCYRVAADGVPEGEDRDEVHDGVVVNGLDYYYIVRLYAAATMEVCAETGGVCIDVVNGLAWQPGDFYDRIHNTPQGADRLGRYLHAALRERL